MIAHKHQMSRHDFAVGLRNGACRAEALAADKAQGGRRVPSVGSAAFSFGGSTRLLTLLPNSRGRIAICAPRLSHSRIARLGPPRRLSNRQRVGAFPPPRTRLAATLSLRLMGRSRQFGFPHNLVRQDRYVPESHSFKSFHGVTFHISEHVMEGVGSAQNPIGEIQYDDC